MELASGENFLRGNQLTKNGIQDSEKEHQAQIDQMESICFLLSAGEKS